MRRITILVASLLCYVGLAEAQQAIFLVRHGDTVRQKGNPDVPLSESGERRALALAALLKESGINVIYTTGLQRTVKTAEPLAGLLSIEPKVNPQLRPRAKPETLISSPIDCVRNIGKYRLGRAPFGQRSSIDQGAGLSSADQDS